MKRETLTTEQALKGAVEMLQQIAKGNSYKAGEYLDRLMAYERALDKVEAPHLHAASRLNPCLRAVVEALTPGLHPG